MDYDTLFSKYLNFSHGVFVEAGANNGIDQSNTVLLENNFGWSGLLVEPNPHKFKECQANRPNSICENFALVSKKYLSDTIDGDFLHTDPHNSLMGLVSDHGDFFDSDLIYYKEQRKRDCQIISVPAITIDSLLTKHSISNIDFFSLDVEGYEISVLNGLDFERHRPRYFLIETTYKNRIDAVTDYMIDKKYRVVDTVSVNDILYEDTL
jgi:FkbM family methyltransferase